MLDFYPRGYVMPEHASLYLNVANPEVCVCVYVCVCMCVCMRVCVCV